MKIKPEHLKHLKKEVDLFLAGHNQGDKLVKDYETGNFPRSEKVKDLQKRFCFDILYRAKINDFVCNELLKYMNDDHIYTALKSVCPKVTRKY